MSCSRYARGLAALSVAVLATGLLFSPLATSQLFPEDAPLASGGTRQLAEPGNGRMIDLWPNQGVGVHGVCERGNPIGAGRPYA